MNWASLSGNDKLAIYGSVAVIIGGLLGFGAGGGIGWLALLAAIAMLIIVLLPMFSPQTTMPGSKGTFMLIAGGIAAVAAILGLLFFLPFMGFWFSFNPITPIFFLVAVAGGLVMGWAGWQAFQGEGGKFQMGAGSTTRGPGTGTGGTMGGTTTTTGTTGTTGTMGDTGTMGGTGTTGTMGGTGSTGTMGGTGTTGTMGDTGMGGTTGTMGETGTDEDRRMG